MQTSLGMAVRFQLRRSKKDVEHLLQVEDLKAESITPDPDPRSNWITILFGTEDLATRATDLFRSTRGVIGMKSA